MVTDIDVISRVTNSLSLKEMVENIKSFLKFVEKNKSQRIYLCRTLSHMVVDYTLGYHLEHMINPQNKRIIILSYEQSPLYLLRSYIGGLKQIAKIILRLNEFLGYCEDFIEPTGIEITIHQINQVIDISESKFNLMNIIATVSPLIIMRFNTANRQFNSQCGVIGEGIETRAILMMFNSRTKENDPVYVFAHELGHAFHLALTHNTQIMPAKFDELNELLGLEKNIPIGDKIELFADMFAMVLLNCPELRKHDPFTEFVRFIPYFDKYIVALARGQL